MKVFIAFLFATFLIAGAPNSTRWLRRPILLLAFCVVVAASFWSRRVIG